MGILSTIFSKIFPSSHAAPAPAAPSATAAAPATAPAAPVTQVDVEAILNGMAQKNAQKAELEYVHRRSDETARPRQQPDRAQDTGTGAEIHR